MVLDKIHKENDIKSLSEEELEELREEIRTFLIESISKTGGHLASNLGAIELTMALHLVCNLPKDKIIFDVGHQSYTHKILTGRKDGFEHLREFGGMSGFPKRSESESDAFDTGHSSTSISAGLGYCYARDLQGDDYKVFSVIGDGAMTGGMSYEALNNASMLKSNFVIVLNDNEMSISENVGGMPSHLSKLRTSDNYTGLKEGIFQSLEKIPIHGDKMVKRIRKTKNSIKQLVIPGMIFEEMGIMYLGPVDGHNIHEMVTVFEQASHIKGPVIVHVCTHKGYGYEPAERHPSRFHGTSPYELEKGLPLKHSKATYTDVFSTVMRKMGDRDDKLVAITAAMEDGTGLRRFHNMFPDRFFDVGIAEEHAVTFASSLALAGMKPVFAVYSSFLQRGYDQILHDVCMQNLPVVFAIDRAGLVGADGETHHGVFDLSYLSMMPNMTIMAPKNKWELSDMLKFAIDFDGPIALRYPRGEAYDGLKEFRSEIELGKFEEIYEKGDILLLAVGSMVSVAESVRTILSQDEISVAICNARFVKPLDTDYLDLVCNRYSYVVTMEENVYCGGFGQQVLSYLNQKNYKGHVISVAIPDEFVSHGSVPLLMQSIDLDPASIAEKILKKMHEEGDL